MAAGRFRLYGVSADLALSASICVEIIHRNIWRGIGLHLMGRPLAC